MAQIKEEILSFLKRMPQRLITDADGLNLLELTSFDDVYFHVWPANGKRERTDSELDVSSEELAYSLLPLNENAYVFADQETAFLYGKRVAGRFGFELRIKTSSRNKRQGIIFKVRWALLVLI
jgi:hypothetical protein